VLPYVVADLHGKVSGAQREAHRSGLADSFFRFAMNIKGAPAMHLPEFAKYRQKTVIGASLSVNAPSGQYDPNILVNIGTNRWALKPEVGISHPYRRWVFEGAAGVWFYTHNTDYFGNSVRTQNPLGSIQAHVVRFLPHRSWLAFDSTFYTGGRSTVNGGLKNDYQGNTRIGVTYGISLSRRQALKFAYFSGATTRVGADIRSVSVAYQIIWMKGRL
jgi:hypothetical protein